MVKLSEGPTQYLVCVLYLRLGYVRTITGVLFSNLNVRMNVLLRSYVQYYLVQVDALWVADHPSKEYIYIYSLSKDSFSVA